MAENVKPIRVQLKRTKGWRMPENTVKVDRTTKWGNPFLVGASRTATPQWAVAAFRRCMDKENGEWWLLDFDPSHGFEDLRGKNLACWCPIGSPCHADVLLELANTDCALRQAVVL